MTKLIPTGRYTCTCALCGKKFTFKTDTDKRPDVCAARLHQCELVKKWLDAGRSTISISLAYFTIRPISHNPAGKNHVCDSRCMGAVGHLCECSCGGKNHGIAKQLGISTLFSEVAQ